MIKLSFIVIFLMHSVAFANICDDANSTPTNTKKFESLVGKCSSLVVKEGNAKDQYNYSLMLWVLFFGENESELELLVGGEADKEFLEKYKREFLKYLSYIKLSAEQGYPEAQLHLGKLYMLEDDFFIIDEKVLEDFRDLKKSFFWFQKSAELGNAEAQYNLSILYADKSATEPNAEKSFYWLIKSVKKEYVRAAGRLSAIFMSMGNYESDVLAHAWFLYEFELTERNNHLKFINKETKWLAYERMRKRYDRAIPLTPDQLKIAENFLYEIIQGEYNDYGIPFSYKSVFNPK